MLYLKKEKEQFEETKAAFTKAYGELLQRMAAVADSKGEDRDTGSPIHHRMSPHDMLAILQAKSRRVESILSVSGWEKSDQLSKVIEESVDIANYCLFIAALCSLLRKEEADSGDSSPRTA